MPCIGAPATRWMPVLVLPILASALLAVTLMLVQVRGRRTARGRDHERSTG